MAMRHLGETLDIHCGGVDNIFPHHENEIAQSEAVTSKPFARLWLHAEHLLVENEKMSKSKGNFYTLRDLVSKGYNAQAIRYLLLSVQYRKQLNFTLDGLQQAQRALDRINEFLYRLRTAKQLGPGDTPEMKEAVERAAGQFEAALDDDLNTAEALGSVFNLIRTGNVALDKEQVREGDRAAILALFDRVDGRLAIVPSEAEKPAGNEDDQEIEALIARRNAARRNRDFAASDQIRQELLNRGILIEDTREGTKWRRK